MTSSFFPSFELSVSFPHFPFSPPRSLWVKWDVQFGAFAYFSFRKGIFSQVWWLRKIACVEMGINFRMSDWSSLWGSRSFLSLPVRSYPKFLLWGIPALVLLLIPHLEGATELNRMSFWGSNHEKLWKTPSISGLTGSFRIDQTIQEKSEISRQSQGCRSNIKRRDEYVSAGNWAICIPEGWIWRILVTLQHLHGEEDIPIYFPCWSHIPVPVDRFIIQSVFICLPTEEDEIREGFLYSQEERAQWKAEGFGDVWDEWCCCCCCVKTNPKILQWVPGRCCLTGLGFCVWGEAIRADFSCCWLQGKWEGSKWVWVKQIRTCFERFCVGNCKFSGVLSQVRDSPASQGPSIRGRTSQHFIPQMRAQLHSWPFPMLQYCHRRESDLWIISARIWEFHSATGGNLTCELSLHKSEYSVVN